MNPTDFNLDIINTAAAAGFDVVFRWVPREGLVDADALSKFNDRHDFSLTEEAMSFALDLKRLAWASGTRTDSPPRTAATAPRFKSLLATWGAEAIDAFARSIMG